MLGSWLSVAIITLALLLTSLGIGFLISLVSDTDIQAVQYAMIVLLTSVFFSGFFLSLEALWEPVRVISWMLPVTYAIHLYRDVMLRGDPMPLALLTSLVAFGSVLFVGAWLLLRRSMGHS
jgi:ABC-2 type transport system permease protein